MNRKVFNCKTITPMFSGDALQDPEIRPTEIKAAMRFWWRAMNSDVSLASLKVEEVKIFGGSYLDSDKKEKSLRSSFNISVNSKLMPVNDDFNNYPYNDGRRVFNILYYLCYGRRDFRNGFVKYYIPAETDFKITIDYKNDQQFELIKELLWLTGTISGVGGKSRNGFGKFLIEELDVSNYQDRIQALSMAKPKGDYTSFSNEVLVYQTKEQFSTWSESLAQIGEAYIYSRLNITNDKYNGEKRKFIGFPLRIITFGRNKNKIIKGIERHTKNYFLTVIKVDNSERPYIGLIIFMPYNYLSNSKPITNIAPAEQTVLLSKYNKVNCEFNSLLDSHDSLIQIIP
jgi:CRISPR type III-B/RAMP module RAMP protein Cmr1